MKKWVRNSLFFSVVLMFCSVRGMNLGRLMELQKEDSLEVADDPHYERLASLALFERDVEMQPLRSRNDTHDFLDDQTRASYVEVPSPPEILSNREEDEENKEVFLKKKADAKGQERQLLGGGGFLGFMRKLLKR